MHHTTRVQPWSSHLLADNITHMQRQQLDPKYLDGDLRVLLSCHCQMIRIDKLDQRCVAQLNQRKVISGTASTVRLSARQAVYNIWGFKLRKGAGTMSAQAVAAFYIEHILKLSGEQPIRKNACSMRRSQHRNACWLSRALIHSSLNWTTPMAPRNHCTPYGNCRI